MTRPKGTNKEVFSRVEPWKVSTRISCIHCIVHAHNAREAIEMAQARSVLFFAVDTKAEKINGSS